MPADPGAALSDPRVAPVCPGAVPADLRDHRRVAPRLPRAGDRLAPLPEVGRGRGGTGALLLGLDPLPEKTDLKPVVTGKVEHDDFVVEKLPFQSRPGLYVTANLYRPKRIEGRLPAVLLLVGHYNRGRNGHKTFMQDHGMWFAENGYVCLIVDTLTRGEIPGDPPRAQNPPTNVLHRHLPAA